MKSLTPLIVCVCAALALTGCGSSSEGDEPATGAPTQAPAEASASDRAASEVCGARDDIQKQVDGLTSLTADTATTATVTSALTAIQADLQKMTAAQPDLTPERKQQVQDATTAFGTELKTIVAQAVAGLSSADAEAQLTAAVESLKSAVKTSLEPIDC